MRVIATYTVAVLLAFALFASVDAFACACSTSAARDPESAGFAMSFIIGALVMLTVPLSMIGGVWWYFRRQWRDMPAVPQPPSGRSV